MEKEEVNKVADAHCHVDLYPNPEETIEKSREKGVCAVISAGTDVKSSIKIGSLVKIKEVFGVVGVHPDAKLEEGDIEQLDKIMKSSKKIVGVGEIGLDSKAAERIPLAEQERYFSAQINLAQKHNMPIVVHARGFLPRVMEILYEKGVDRAMLHFFSGDEKDAIFAEKRGYLVSIPPLESGRLRRVIKTLDLGTIVTETDGPVVGKEPSDVIGTVKRIAEFKGKPVEDVSATTTETLKEYFGLIL